MCTFFGQMTFNFAFNNKLINKTFGYFKIFLAFSPIIILFITSLIAFKLHYYWKDQKAIEAPQAEEVQVNENKEEKSP
jgi:uncharacterized membrane protein YpjA